MPISSSFPFEKNELTVHGHTMAYVGVGENHPIGIAIAEWITTAVRA